MIEQYSELDEIRNAEHWILHVAWWFLVRFLVRSQAITTRIQKLLSITRWFWWLKLFRDIS